MGVLKTNPIDYAIRYQSGCRDCADENGICPMNGTPCNSDAFRAVIEHTLRAWTYGIKYGYMENPFEGMK